MKPPDWTGYEKGIQLECPPVCGYCSGNETEGLRKKNCIKSGPERDAEMAATGDRLLPPRLIDLKDILCRDRIGLKSRSDKRTSRKETLRAIKECTTAGLKELEATSASPVEPSYFPFSFTHLETGIFPVEAQKTHTVPSPITSSEFANRLNNLLCGENGKDNKLSPVPFETNLSKTLPSIPQNCLPSILIPKEPSPSRYAIHTSKSHPSDKTHVPPRKSSIGTSPKARVTHARLEP